MQKFAGWSGGKLQRYTGWWKCGLVLALAGLLAGTGRAQTPVPANDNFANAEVISGLSGSTNVDNIGATLEPGEPTTIITDDNGYGVAVGASVWYSWTAPANGSVTFNTFTNGPGFDTLLAVYTGNSVNNLTLLAANDDAPGVTNATSETSFYALAGTTYFIGVYGVVDPPLAEGVTMLNWVQSTPGYAAGEFRFASTNYNMSDFESVGALGPNPPMSATAGARISVTRVGGAVGKVQVHYTVTTNFEVETIDSELDVANYSTQTTDTNGNLVAESYGSVTNYYEWIYDPLNRTNYCSLNAQGLATGYTVESSTTVFSSGTVPPTYTTNATPPFYIPFPIYGPGQLFTLYTNGYSQVTNTDLSVTTGSTNTMAINSQIQTNVPGAVPLGKGNNNGVWDFVPAQGYLTFNDFEMTKDILVTVNTNDPIALNPIQFMVTLDSAALDTNELQSIPAPTLDPARTNAVVNLANGWQASPLYGLCGGYPNSSLYLSNIYSFERSTLRVNRNGGNATIGVTRRGTDFSLSQTIYYSIDVGTLNANLNNFTKQSGSDYAIPDNATKSVPEGVVDFTNYSIGSLTWAANDIKPKYITVPIVNNNTVEFNKDFYIQFYADNGHKWPDYSEEGEIDACTVTILFERETAGAVDTSYNTENSGSTSPKNMPHPGANGTVYAVLVDTNTDNTLIGGQFTGYNETNSYSIVRALPNGQADYAFVQKTGLGADGTVDALALDANENIYIGGTFDSFDGIQRYSIARLNPDGSLDNSGFLPGNGVQIFSQDAPPALGSVSAILIQPDGRILVAGDFNYYNNTNRNCIVRLNPDGTVDPTFDPGVGPDEEYTGVPVINSMALQANGAIVIGGDFTSVDGTGRNFIARLNSDGSLDTSFDPGTGANDVVNTVAVDANGLILAGGNFTQLGALGTSAGLTRLNADGSIDTTFGIGQGASGFVNTLSVESDGTILVGGNFTSINQTRRIGIARLLPDGTLDTSFMDTAYNQFAGLINPYYNPNVNSPNSVYSMSQQPDGNIMIGGSFYQVGGGSTRADYHARNNVARLIGGTTPGPGNIALAQTSYSADPSSGPTTNSAVTIGVNRINGTLGPASATLDPVTLPAGPGAAVYGSDFVFAATPITYGTTWANTWMLSDGVSGGNNGTQVTVYNNSNPNATLDLQLTQPVGSDIFFLGGNNLPTSTGIFNPKYTEQDGENIPLGVALGQSLAPLTIIHNTTHPGALSFTSVTYTTNQTAPAAIINLTRTGGSDGSVTVYYKIVPGTAQAGIDYTVPSKNQISFAKNITSAVIVIPLNNSGLAHPDRFLGLQIYTPGGGATMGAVTNAELQIIDAYNSSGTVSFSGGVPVQNVTATTTNIVTTYGTNENTGPVMVTVSRQGGSLGVLAVTVASSGGTAVNGVNYVGFTNVLTWNSGISGPTNLFLPVKDDGVYTPNLTVNLSLNNATVNGTVTASALGGVSTNALVTITNVDFPGTLEFSAPSYAFNENGGSAIIPVIRTGGTAGTISAWFSTEDGTAVQGVQYVTNSGALVFTNGQVGENFQVPIIDNQVQDINYKLTLILTNNGLLPAALGAQSNATLTIINNEIYNYPPGQVDGSYNPSAGFSGPVYALALEPSDNRMLVGGGFTNADGVARNNIARLNTDGSLDQYFSSATPGQGANDVVRSVIVESNGTIVIGGFFTNYNGFAYNHIARLVYNGGLDSTFVPGAGSDNPIYSIAQSFINGASVLYVGGAFTTFGGQNRKGIARLNDNGTVDSSFNPLTGANGTVYCLAVQSDGRVVIGGDFTTVNNVPLNHIARLNLDGSVDMTFTNALTNPAIGANASVHSLAIQLDGRILIGGLFTNVDGVAMNHIARLNANGTLDAGFTPGLGADDDVLSISLQSDTRIVVGGDFTLFSGVTRNRITRLLPDGTVDPTINFGTGADSFVAATDIQPDGNIVLGGGFLNYDGAPHARLVRIYGGSAAGSGEFQFTSAAYTVNQTNGVAMITVQRLGGTSGPTNNPTGDILVNLYTTDGTATNGINYLGVNTNLDFPAGEVLKTVTIPVIAVAGISPPLTVNLTITNAYVNGTNETAPATMPGQYDALLTIIDSQSAVSLQYSNYSVGKGAVNGAGIITLTRQGDTNGTCSVDFATTFGGTALIGTDYTPVQGTVTFNPGDAVQTFQIPINNNGIPEGNQTVTFSIGNPQGTFLESPTNGTLTIIDNVPAPGQFTFSATNYTITEGGSSGVSGTMVTVLRVNGSANTEQVAFSTTNGTAISGLKYLSTNGVLTFPGGSTSASFLVQALNTTTAEGPEYFWVLLSNPSGTSGLISPTNATVTILNTNIGIAFASATNSFTEPFGVSSLPGTVSLGVVRFNNTNVTTKVNYSTADGTATNGINYVATNGTLTFLPGISVTNITVTTLYDAPYVLGDLYFTASLSLPTNLDQTAQLTAPTTTTVIDHDANAGLSFFAPTTSVGKTDGIISIGVVCLNPSQEPASVVCSTVDGSAKAGVDYVYTSTNLVFAGGMTSTNFTVRILSTTQVQSNKTFSVTMSQFMGYGVPAFYTNETITIINANTPYGLSFSTPQVISGPWGSTSVDDTLGAPEIGDPSIAGNPPTAPVWFQWTAPADGEVTMDTIGSYSTTSQTTVSYLPGIFTPVFTTFTNNIKLDTVLGVFTGGSLSTLNQVAVNDDMYPIPLPELDPYVGQENEWAQNIYDPYASSVTNSLPASQSFQEEYFQPFGGPSELRFNAKAGVTYYIAVDVKPVTINFAPSPSSVYREYENLRGPVSLNWAYHPSGVFRFATELVDMSGLTATNGNPLLLYQCAETESDSSAVEIGPFNVNEYDTLHGTYYSPEPQGLLVTVTRVAGSSGRVSVDYATADGNPAVLTNGDNAAIAGTDYTPVSGTLIFDDFEMSKTILIPISYNSTSSLTGQPNVQPNRDFTVALSNPQRDPQESSAVSAPRVDSIFGTALCRILDCNIDPKEPLYAMVPMISTNPFTGLPMTNTVAATLSPTNAVFNFAKAVYRVQRDEGLWFGTNKGVPVTVYVARFGTNMESVTLHWRLDNDFLDKDSADDSDYVFPLQPGSDYAVPTPATVAGILGVNSDFAGVGGDSGTITFPAKTSPTVQGPSQKIQFTLNDNSLTEFNRDILISLYGTDSKGNPLQVGMNNQATVTILFSDTTPPAGSVDQLYNPDFASDLAFPTNTGYLGSSVVNPGTELYSEVYSLVVLPNNGVTAGNQSLIAGAFTTYTDGNNTYTVNGIARLNYDGSLDTTFNPGSGVNVFPGGEFIRTALLTSSNQIVIGGDFSSYDGTQRNCLARLNSDGSLDTTFTPGGGANGTVWGMALQADGRVVIGGDFTTYNGNPANHVARINTDGSLDTTFNAGTNLNAAVYAVALESDTNTIVLGGAFTSVGGPHGQNYIVRLNSDGSLDTTFNTVTGPNKAVRSLSIQPDDKVLAGGDFTLVAGQSDNHIVRFNVDGSLDSSFNSGIGTDGTVYNIDYSSLSGTNITFTTNATSGVITTNMVVQGTNSIYVGGAFTSFNGTHRLGFVRLYPDGTVDTTFLDTSYNQFAGLPRIFYKDPPGTVYASGLQDDGNVMIAGSFQEVGGGQADQNVRNYLEEERGLTPSYGDPHLLVSEGGLSIEPKSRDGVRNRGNVARLVGGATPGPGNLGMVASSYAVNKTQVVEPVTLVRTNGSLGYASANFSVIPGLAQSGLDYSYSNTPPIYPIEWEYDVVTRDHIDGLFGPDGQFNDKYGRLEKFGVNGPASVNISIINDTATAGSLSARLQLANPIGADQFYLGGENIPVGVALGESQVPLTIVDNSHQDGVFSFASSSFTSASTPAYVGISRTDGAASAVQVYYQTVTNGSTAVASVDYVLTNGVVAFNQNQSSNSFPITILANNSSSGIEKTVNLQLYNIQDSSIGGNASLGLTNAVLRIINPNFQGYLNFTTNYYSTNLSAGSISFSVSRTVGSKGSLSVQYATADGTATNNVNYLGSTNTLTWTNGDISPRTVTIPLANNGAISAAYYFRASIFNAMLNGTNWPSLLGGTTNATLNIINDNNHGTFQFSSPQYLVNENGGYATITVTRTGSAFGTASVVFATSDGTALSGTNYNYLGVTNTLLFADRQVNTNLTITIFPQDTTNLPPAGFFFNVALSLTNNANGGASLGSPASATVNIVATAAYNQPPGSLDPSFDPTVDFNGGVLGLALQSNGQIVAGGLFTSVSGANLNYVARLNTDGTLDTGFLSGQSGASGYVNAVLCQTDQRILIGGAFTNVDGLVFNHVARLMTDGTIDNSFAPGSGADNSAFSLAETFLNGARVLYVGGAFSTFNGLSSPGVVRLDNYGDVDTSFATGLGANGPVYAIAVYPTNSIYNNGSLLVGGSFTNFNNLAVGNLVRLNQDGSVDTNFSSASAHSLANSTVRSIAIQPDGEILIGGDFTNVDEYTVNHLARLNPDGSLDNAFNNSLAPGFNGTVDALVVQPDNRIVVAGQFSQANGVNRNNITRLMPSGATDTTINFGDGANGTIAALLLQPTNDFIVIGGSFTEVEDQPLQYIARLYGGSVTGTGQFTFSSANYQVDETNGFATITVVRTGGSSGPTNGLGNVSVNFATSNLTAVAGTNYTGTNETLVFVPGQVFQTVAIPVRDDGVVTPNLTVALTLSNPSPTNSAGLGDQSTAVLTIINDDSGVSFASANYSVPKDTVIGVANIGIVRLGSTSGSCSVFFTTTTNGTAVTNVDYYATNGTVIFNSGVSEVMVQVPIINNNIPEGQRTVAMLLTNAVGFVLASPTNAILTIIDTVNAPGQLSFATNSYTVVKTNGNAYLTVVRTNGFSGAVSVNYSTVAGAGTALPGVNYLVSSGTLSLGDGVTSGQIAIPLLDNNQVQGTVDFFVNLSDAQGGATLLAPTNADVNIMDHNFGVSFQSATNYTVENSGFASVVVQRIGATNNPFSVGYSTTAGTALPGTNYTPVSGTLNFAPGESLQAITIPVLYSSNQISDLFFNVGLFNATNGAALVAPTNSFVIIHDSNAGLSFSNSVASVLENAGGITIAVICSNPSIEPVVLDTNDVPLEVNYFTTNGSATAGIDYTATNGTLVFTNGIGTNYFTVPISYNNALGTNRTFNVVLAAPTAPGVLVAPSTETVTIVNVNSGVEFSKPNYSVLKSGITATINVYRSGYTNSIVGVNYSTTNGTAVAGVNFIATNSSLLFTNGVTAQSFSVPVINSTALQPDLTVLLQLSGATNAALVYPSFATLTIVDLSGSFVVPAGAVLVTNQVPTNSLAGANNPGEPYAITYTPGNFNGYPGIIYPGLTNTLAFAFRASSGTNVSNLIATLLPTNGIAAPSGAQSYGPLIAGGHSVSRPFTFTANGTNGQQIAATFMLQNVVNHVTNNIGTNSFTFYLGTWTASYSNTAAILINGMGANSTYAAAASPYPSAIIVSNLTGVILKTTVTVTNLTHADPTEIQALVVAPNQQNTLIMAADGGSHSVNGITLTFDDAATNSLPHTGQIVTSTNKPTSFTQPTFH